jgi:hypothetical protein
MGVVLAPCMKDPRCNLVFEDLLGNVKLRECHNVGYVYCIWHPVALAHLECFSLNFDNFEPLLQLQVHE